MPVWMIEPLDIACYDAAMAKPLTDDQRSKVAEKIMDWGNYVFTGLVISQALEGRPYAVARIIVGVVIMTVAYWAAVRLLERRATL